jgi:hypothetical protein
MSQKSQLFKTLENVRLFLHLLYLSIKYAYILSIASVFNTAYYTTHQFQGYYWMNVLMNANAKSFI